MKNSISRCAFIISTLLTSTIEISPPFINIRATALIPLNIVQFKIRLFDFENTRGEKEKVLMTRFILCRELLLGMHNLKKVNAELREFLKHFGKNTPLVEKKSGCLKIKFESASFQFRQ